MCVFVCVCVCVCVCVQRGDKLVDYDGKQEKPLSRDDIKAQDGWLWKGDWKKDNNRAVDEDGRS